MKVFRCGGSSQTGTKTKKKNKKKMKQKLNRKPIVVVNSKRRLHAVCMWV